MIALSLSTLLFAPVKRKSSGPSCPPRVEKTVAAQSQGATIKGFSQEKENGQTYYEAEMAVSGHTKDVLIDPAGAVVEVEEQVALDSLPAAVKDGLQAKAGKGKILKVESLTKHVAKLVAYKSKRYRPTARNQKFRSAPTASLWTTKSN